MRISLTISLLISLIAIRAQLPDPRSQAWADLPDAPASTCCAPKGIPVELVVVDAQGPVAGAIISGLGCTGLTHPNGHGIIFIPLEMADDTLTVEAPGYQAHRQAILPLITEWPLDTVTLVPSAREAAIPGLDAATAYQRLIRLGEMALTDAAWQAILLVGVGNDLRCWSPEQIVWGNIYAPLGFSRVGQHDPAGWQFRINSGYRLSETGLVELLALWMQSDPLLTGGYVLDSARYQGLAANGWFGLHWVAQDTVGFCWVNADETRIVLNLTVGAAHLQVVYQQVKGRLLPVLVCVHIGGKTIQVQLMHGHSLARPFRGDFGRLPARLARGEYHQPCGRPFIDDITAECED